MTDPGPAVPPGEPGGPTTTAGVVPLRRHGRPGPSALPVPRVEPDAPAAAPGPAPDRASIVGRDTELAAIDEFVGAVAHRSCGLLLSGEPGIGKTVLWEAAIAAARARGH